MCVNTSSTSRGSAEGAGQSAARGFLPYSCDSDCVSTGEELKAAVEGTVDGETKVINLCPSTRTTPLELVSVGGILVDGSNKDITITCCGQSLTAWYPSSPRCKIQRSEKFLSSFKLEGENNKFTLANLQAFEMEDDGMAFHELVGDGAAEAVPFINTPFSEVTGAETLNPSVTFYNCRFTGFQSSAGSPRQGVVLSLAFNLNNPPSSLVFKSYYSLYKDNMNTVVS